MPHVMAASKLALQGTDCRHRDEDSTRPRPAPIKTYSACGSDFRLVLFLSIACSSLLLLTLYIQTSPQTAASAAFS